MIRTQNINISDNNNAGYVTTAFNKTKIIRPSKLWRRKRNIVVYIGAGNSQIITHTVRLYDHLALLMSIFLASKFEWINVSIGKQNSININKITRPRPTVYTESPHHFWTAALPADYRCSLPLLNCCCSGLCSLLSATLQEMIIIYSVEKKNTTYILHCKHFWSNLYLRFISRDELIMNQLRKHGVLVN